MGYQLANASLTSLNFLRLATHPVQMAPESLSFFELPQMTSQWLILVVSCGVSGFPGQSMSWVSTKNAFKFRNHSHAAQ